MRHKSSASRRGRAVATQFAPLALDFSLVNMPKNSSRVFVDRPTSVALRRSIVTAYRTAPFCAHDVVYCAQIRA